MVYATSSVAAHLDISKKRVMVRIKFCLIVLSGLLAPITTCTWRFSTMILSLSMQEKVWGGEGEGASAAKGRLLAREFLTFKWGNSETRNFLFPNMVSRRLFRRAGFVFGLFNYFSIKQYLPWNTPFFSTSPPFIGVWKNSHPSNTLSLFVLVLKFPHLLLN